MRTESRGIQRIVASVARLPSLMAVTIITGLANCGPGRADEPAAPRADEDRFLVAVRAFADAMIEHGRDRYGSVHSPMYAADLDLETRQLPERRPPAPPGADDYGTQRYSFGGSNLMWDILTLRAQYLLSEVTGQASYARAADDYLRFFVDHCPSSTTGLFPWGQHAFWKLRTEDDPRRLDDQRWRWYGEAGGGGAHEFESFTPPWREMRKFGPETILEFAQGVFDWHIKCEKTFFFNRHGVLYDRRNPDQRPPFPPPIGTRDMAWERHAGLYMYTFAFAYQQTGEARYLEWARGLSDLYWNVRDPETDKTWPSIWMDADGGLIPDPRHTTRNVLSQQPYWKLKAYRLAPEAEQARVLRDRALAYLRAYCRTIDAATGQRTWNSANAQGVEGQMIALAYKVSGETDFRDWLTAWSRAAFRHRPHACESGRWQLMPGNYANVLVGLIQSHLITGDPVFLDQAADLADESLALFQHESGLMCAAVTLQAEDGRLRVEPYGYYNNHTGVQKLVYALLQLHILRNGLEHPVEHMY
ncbi:MAG: hypothetical protein EA424_18235 [Planctomycetaceae bacterium]|nr:MAG: hypothetical protein EA424_18235 [Planctomycetaceae bacterium]